MEKLFQILKYWSGQANGEAKAGEINPIQTGLVFLHATEGAEEGVLAPYNFKNRSCYVHHSYTE